MGTTYNIASGGFSCGQQIRLEGISKDKNITTILNLNVREEITKPTGTNLKDGSVNLFIDGGTKPYSVTWSDGKVGTFRDGMDYGVYTYRVTDFHGDMINVGCITFEEEIVEEITVETKTIEKIETPIVYESLCLTDGKINYKFHHDYGNGMRWTNTENNLVLDFNEENNRWEISNWEDGKIVKNNGVPTKIPIGSDWNNNGKLWKVYKGDCTDIEDSITLSINNETCYGLNDGSVVVKINGDRVNNNYQYRIQGISPYPEFQDSEIFTRLKHGKYIVEAKNNEKVLTKEFSINYDNERSFVNVYLNKEGISGDNASKTVKYKITSDYDNKENVDIEVYIDIVYTKEYNCPNNENGCLIEPIFNFDGLGFNFDEDNVFTKNSCEDKTTTKTIKSKGSKKIILNNNSKTFTEQLTHGINTFDHTWADCGCKAYAKSKIEILISKVNIDSHNCFDITQNGSFNNDIYLKDCIKQ